MLCLCASCNPQWSHLSTWKWRVSGWQHSNCKIMSETPQTNNMKALRGKKVVHFIWSLEVIRFFFRDRMSVPKKQITCLIHSSCGTWFLVFFFSVLNYQHSNSIHWRKAGLVQQRCWDYKKLLQGYVSTSNMGTTSLLREKSKRGAAGKDNKLGEEWGNLIFCYFMLLGLTIMFKLFGIFFNWQ